MKKLDPELLKNLQPFEKQIFEWIIKAIEEKEGLRKPKNSQEKKDERNK